MHKNKSLYTPTILVSDDTDREKSPQPSPLNPTFLSVMRNIFRFSTIAGLMLLAVNANAFDANKAFSDIAEAKKLAEQSVDTAKRAAALAALAAAAAAPAAAAAAAAATANADAEAAAADAARLRRESLAKEDEAKKLIHTTCAGRFGVLYKNLNKSITRSEGISIVGASAGLIGAIATCPHCSVLFAGIAGLANPFQKVFSENQNAPNDIRGEISRLSAKITTDIAEYIKLPPAKISDSDTTFEANSAARLDKLYEISANCTFYDTFAASVTSATNTTSEAK